MDEKYIVKKIATGAKSDGTNRVMELLPYAKDVEYKDGAVRLTFEFFNDMHETEMTMQIGFAPEIAHVFDTLLYGEEEELEG